MKSISTKIIVLTIILLVSMVAFLSFWSLYIFNRDNIAYTLQSQQLQAQVLAKRIDLALVQSPNDPSVFNLLKDECDGLKAAAFEQNGKLILLCDPSVSTLYQKSPKTLEKILGSSFSSGTQKSEESNDEVFWSYAALLSGGKVILITSKNIANRLAYLLGLQIALLALTACGISILLSLWVAKTVADPIKIVSEATKKIAEGHFEEVIKVRSRDETRTLADAVNLMTQKIKILMQSEREKVKLEQQLEVAGVVQRILIPDTFIKFGRLKAHSYYRSADQCGGDWWGYVVGKKKLAIFIGDVTGHGYPSALLVATSRGYLSMLQDQVNQTGELNFKATEALEILNRVVYDAAKGELNMTALCLIIDQETQSFTLANAGHVALIQIRPSLGTFNDFKSRGQRLGEGKNLFEPIQEMSGSFLQDDKFVLYTDGIYDLGPLEKRIRRKGLYEFLKLHLKDESSTIVDAFQKELISLNRGRSLDDDVTFVLIETDNSHA